MSAARLVTKRVPYAPSQTGRTGRAPIATSGAAQTTAALVGHFLGYADGEQSGRQVVLASVRRDYAAIAAALELPRSSGQVEGHVTTSKLRKREMYGRSKLDLLRRRVLLAR